MAAGSGLTAFADADPAHTTQVNQAGTPFKCLLQNDVNLSSPPLPATVHEHKVPRSPSHFTNAPFRIDDYIAPEDTTCPAPGASAPNGVPKGSGLPGGCTRDLVHRFYQEQYQLDGGRQDRYVTGSDAVGLAMGYYDTRRLPIYEYLHGRRHPPTRSRTGSSRPPSAVPSLTISGWWRRRRLSSTTPATTGRRTICTRRSTPTGCPTTTRCTRRRGPSRTRR